MSLDSLPPLREGLAAAGLGPDKRLGQHFLLDLNLTRKIARLAQVGEGDTVLEVGPGPGGLTRALLETGARVVAIEKDARFLPLLADVARAAPGQLTVTHGDAMAMDALALAGPCAPIVANLPYNVASPLLARWLTGPLHPASLTLMFQAEVAERITAAPGGRDYGRLGVLCQALTEGSIVMRLPARAFTPPPKVDSAVVRLVPRLERPPAPHVAALQKITAAAFGQRRKMLRSSLKTLGGAEFAIAAGIDPELRAEAVSVEKFLRLAEILADRQG